MERLLSARFWVTLMIVGSVCAAFLLGRISAEAFLPLAILVIEWYFRREDRKKRGGE